LKPLQKLKRTNIPEMQPHCEHDRFASSSRLTQDLRKEQTDLGIGDRKTDSRGPHRWWLDRVVGRKTGITEVCWKAACFHHRGLGPFTSCPRLDDLGR
jgi:hypothetical protein